MTTLPTSPLAALVAAAQKRLPAETGATAKAAARIARGDVRYVLADVSQSMAEPAGGRTKAALLEAALSSVRGSSRLVVFSSYPADLAPTQPLPAPGGSTALHLALDHIRPHDPTHVLVISDGHPDDAAAALAAADRLGSGVRIDVIYCGPDHDKAGMAFMRKLARGGGAAHHRSITRAPERLAPAVRLLALPGR